MISAAPMAIASENPGSAAQRGEDTRVLDTSVKPGPKARPNVVGEAQPIAVENDLDVLVVDPGEVALDVPMADDGDTGALRPAARHAYSHRQ